MTVQILQGDCRQLLATLPEQSVHCIVTSPPYFAQRDYSVDGQIGLEPSPQAYVDELVKVFRAAGRVLRDDGTLWLNLGDTLVTNGGSGWQGKNGDRADRRFTQERGGTAKLQAHMKIMETELRPKNLIGIPWRVAFALQADGWYLRQDIIWHKPNPMPESVKDRCTKAHEYIFMLTKEPNYYFDAAAIAEDVVKVGTEKHLLGGPGKRSGSREGLRKGARGTDASGFKDARCYNGKHSDKQRGHGRRYAGFNERWDNAEAENLVPSKRNKRSVWTVATRPFEDAHFATFPPDLIEPCILAGCPKGGTVLDPFGGAGTTGLVADRLQRSAILCELNADYVAMARARIDGDAPLFKEAAE